MTSPTLGNRARAHVALIPVGARVVVAKRDTDRQRIIESLSDDELAIWLTLFGELPPVRIAHERRERLRRRASGERRVREPASPLAA